MSDITPASPTNNQVSRSTRLNHNDANSITTFGSENQRSLGQVSTELLNRVRSKQVGEIGSIILRLQQQLGHIEVAAEEDESSMIARVFGVIPGFKALVKKGKAVASQFESVSENLEDIKSQLDKGKIVLDKDNVTLETMKGKQRDYLNKITEDIKEGDAKLTEMKSVVIPELQARIDRLDETSDDKDLLVDQLSEYVYFTNALDKKVADLRANKTHALLTMPQIRVIQQGNSELIRQLDSAMYDAIPVWLNQVVLALATEHQKKAVEMKQLFSRALNESVTNTAEQVHRNSVEIARESEKTTISVESLKSVTKAMTSTLDDVLKIQKEGMRQRELLAGQLDAVEGELMQKVLTVAEATATAAKRLGQ